ncbi:uncharacterized protein LOC142996305 isoform X2 [Genypterus blacodes]
MEAEPESGRPNNGQLIYVAPNDTIRLLEVYVKRSLSLNDGTLGTSAEKRREKWVPVKRRLRRHSSDPSLFLSDSPRDGEITTFATVETPPAKPEKRDEETKKKKKRKTKRGRKLSLWKSFLGLFSPKGGEETDGEESPGDAQDHPTGDETAEAAPAPASVVVRRQSRSQKIKRRLSLISIKRQSRSDVIKEVNPADITGVESVMSVEPTYSYYERVSEEMQKIVHEVKEKEEVLSDEELIKRLIDLTKEQGDAIDDKLKENPALNSFFQQMSYSAFKQMADAYLETEATPTVNKTLSVPPTAPELVSLAFTLDFTARLAALHRQNIGLITGLGNRYLQDKFEYKQACTDHPWPDCDDAND